MPHYRTEIVVPADRYVFLRLPPDFPEGPAHVSVVVPDPAGPDPAGLDPDRDDIEWWEEFDEGPGAADT